MTHNEQEERNNWQYWSKKRSFTLMEGMMLELGVLPPREPEAPSAKQKLTAEFLRICFDHLELMYSSLRVDEKCGKEWEAVSEDDAVSKIISRELFDKHWNECKLARHNKFSDAAPKEDMGERERGSLLRMVVGMAMKKFTFNPVEGKRSSATKHIKDALEEYQIPLDDETILKYLREGANLVPDEIKRKFGSH